MPAVKIQDNDYIGVVSVPALGLELPVMSDWSYARLDIAPCRYSGSAYADDLVIAGHSYRSHFSPLWQLSGGEEVIFTDTVGNVFTYKVTSVETVQPTDIELMVGDPDDADKGWDLTLFTCTYDSRARVAVRCSKTEWRHAGDRPKREMHRLTPQLHRMKTSAGGCDDFFAACS